MPGEELDLVGFEAVSDNADALGNVPVTVVEWRPMLDEGEDASVAEEKLVEGMLSVISKKSRYKGLAVEFPVFVTTSVWLPSDNRGDWKNTTLYWLYSC